MAALRTPATRRSVEDHLGPAETRFFGAGFRRVGYTVNDVTTTADAVGGFRLGATAGVSYPRDWSRKSSTHDLRPHFSTVDALVLGIDLSVLGIADARGLDITDAATAHARSVRIHAANRPQEDLTELPATVVAEPPASTRLGEHVRSHTDCRIGTMRVRCEIEHVSGIQQAGTRHYDNPTPVLGPDAERYYGSGFTGWQQHVDDVRIDRVAMHADATLSISPDRTGLVSPPVSPASSGITKVDAFVSALQLGQVLLYKLDEMDRAESDTLWMRQTTLTATRPDPKDVAGCQLRTWLENTKVIAMSNRLWRTADIVGDLGGVSLRCSVTHRLPQR